MASNNVSLTTQEAKEHIRFVVDVLTDIKKQLTLSAHSDFGQYFIWVLIIFFMAIGIII